MVVYVFDLLREFIELVVKLLSRLIKWIVANKNKILPEK